MMWVIVVIAGSAAVLLAVTQGILLACLWRRDARPRKASPFAGQIREGQAVIDALPFEEIFITSHDGLSLCGRFYPSASPSPDAVVAVHGYRSSGRDDFSVLLPFYHAQGWNVLLIDQRAHGNSGGHLIGMGALERFDCRRWTQVLHQRLETEHGRARILLHGVSMGGATVLMAGALPLPDSVCGIVSDCGYTSTWEAFAHVLRRRYHLPPFPLLYLFERLCRLEGGYSFRSPSPLEAAAAARVPVIIVHGAEDRFVPVWMAHLLYEACSQARRLLIAPGARHAQSAYTASEAYFQMIEELENIREEAFAGGGSKIK